MGKVNICWKLETFASKALISCIFPLNITNFFWFSWKTHVCTMFLIKIFFPWDYKRPKNNQCLPGKRYISCPQVIYLHFSSEISCFELSFIYPFRTYIYTTISIKKLFINWLNNTRKTKVPCLWLLNQLLRACFTNHQRNCQYFPYHQFTTDQKVM